MTETKKIPEGWKEVKLQEISNKITDGTHKTPKYVKEGIPFLSTNNLIPFSRKFKFNKYIKHITLEEHKDLIKRCNPEKGDLLISKCGTIGRTQQVNVDYEFSIFVGLALVKINKDKVIGDFLEQVFNWNHIVHQMELNAPGATRKTLTIKGLSNIKFLLPPIPEQEKIASILSKVDDQIQTTEEIITKSEELKKGLMQDIFNNEKQKQWNTSKIKDVVIKLKRGHSLATNSIGKGVIYMTSGFLQDNYIDWSIEKYLDTDKPLDNCLLVKGDVILNCVNSWAKLGKVAVFEGYKKPVVVGFNNFGITFNNKINPFFAKYFLLTKRIQYLLRAVSKPAVQQVSFSGSDLLRLEIKYPSIEEQNKIITVLMGVDNNIQDNKAELDRLQELKKGLMQDLLTGKVRVAM